MLSGIGKKLTLILLIILFTATGLIAQSLSLTSELEKEELWLGDSVQLNLYLQGSDDAISPGLVIPDVRVEPLGGTVRSSRSVTSINGKVTENIRKAYVYVYKLTPKKAGQIIIPAIEVVVGGNQLSSRQLSLDVKQPQTSTDFKLKLEFDRDRVYLNEEFSLKVSFLYGQSLRSLEIMIPGIESLPYESIAGTGSDERYEIILNGSPVIFSRDDSQGMSGLSTILKIRPEALGVIRLENPAASFESVTGSKRVQDIWGRIQNQEIYGRTVIPGSPGAIQVLPFPEEGRPDDFFGLSGKISVDLSVEPDEVHIGDPLTLNLTVSGMNNTDLRIPPLGSYLGAGVDIPETRASAGVEGRSKTITQTIRIKDPSVTQIPPVKFSYFDTESESYKYAVSEAVTLRVLDTKIVTASELEGADARGEEDVKILLEKKREGLYYNYSGNKLLSSDRIMTERLIDSILIKLLLIIPPVLFLIFVIYTWLLPQMRAQAEARVDRSRALRRLKKTMLKTRSGNPKSILKDFNMRLSDFLKLHGLTDDYIELKDVVELINSILYGRMEVSLEEARKIAFSAIDILQDKAARNV